MQIIYVPVTSIAAEVIGPTTLWGAKTPSPPFLCLSISFGNSHGWVFPSRPGSMLKRSGIGDADRYAVGPSTATSASPYTLSGVLLPCLVIGRDREDKGRLPIAAGRRFGSLIAAEVQRRFDDRDLATGCRYGNTWTRRYQTVVRTRESRSRPQRQMER